MPIPFPALTAVWLVVINAVAFLTFAADKRRAVARMQRVPEARLLQLTALGGGLGALAAQQAFRHKTRKQPFQNRFRLILGLQAALMLFLISGGARLLRP